MIKFKIGDRVRSKVSGRLGTVMPPDWGKVHICWDDSERNGLVSDDLLERVDSADTIPDSLVVEFTPHFADSDIGRGAYTIKGIDPQKLNGKFRLVPVE